MKENCKIRLGGNEHEERKKFLAADWYVLRIDTPRSFYKQVCSVKTLLEDRYLPFPRETIWEIKP